MNIRGFKNLTAGANTIGTLPAEIPVDADDTLRFDIVINGEQYRVGVRANRTLEVYSYSTPNTQANAQGVITYLCKKA